MIYDISIPISNSTITWVGDPSVNISAVASITDGDVCNVTNINMGAHTGTHIDAPFHFINSGKTIEQIVLENCYGSCHVVEVEGGIISEDDINRVFPKNCTRIIFKTRNSKRWELNHPIFDTRFVGLSSGAATLLAQKGVKLIGMDYLSVEPYVAEDDNPVHNTLLGAEIVLLEGCNLTGIEEGEYTLSAFPVKIVGADGAPCRAVLIK